MAEPSMFRAFLAGHNKVADDTRTPLDVILIVNGLVISGELIGPEHHHELEGAELEGNPLYEMLRIDGAIQGASKAAKEEMSEIADDIEKVRAAWDVVFVRKVVILPTATNPIGLDFLRIRMDDISAVAVGKLPQSP